MAAKTKPVVTLDKFIIKGAQPFDGEHEVDLSQLNGHDLHLIKQHSGVRVGELDEALSAGDYDVMVAVCQIALQRKGHPEARHAITVLMDAPIGSLTFEWGTVSTNGDGDDADPPPTS